MQGQTSTTIGQQALNLIGGNFPALTGVAPNFDSSTAGKALASIYVPTVQAVQRQHGWDASRRVFALVPSGNAAPFPFGFTREYVYPTNGIEVWEVQPLVPVDVNDPLPLNNSIGNTLVNGVQTKVIWCDVPNAYATYNNNPSEATWDALFTEAVVRVLASKLALVLVSKPETATFMGQTGQQAGEMNKMRDA